MSSGVETSRYSREGSIYEHGVQLEPRALMTIPPLWSG